MVPQPKNKKVPCLTFWHWFQSNPWGITVVVVINVRCLISPANLSVEMRNWILYSMYLGPNWVASNRLKSPFSYIYCATIYVHTVRYCQNFNSSILFSLEDGKHANNVANRSEGVQPVLPGMWGLWYLFHFSCSACRMSAKSILLPKTTHLTSR